MSRERRYLGNILLWCILASGRVSLGGYVVEVKISGSQAIAPGQDRAIVMFDQNRVKISTGSKTASATDVLYTASDGVARVVEHRSRDYYQVDGNMLAAAGSAADMVKNLFTGADTAEASALRVVATKKIRKLNGIPCQQFSVMRGETRIQELWVTSWKHAGITKSDLKALYAFAGLYEQTRPFFSVDVDLPMDAVLRLDGFPVQLTQFCPNGKTVRITLNRPTATRAGQNAFALPHGYVRRAL